jgi:hypothetical protein
MTLNFSNGGYVALISQTPQPRNFRLLLDQGFPNPPGFTVRSIDNTVEVVHLSQFDRTLSERSTPDWVLYCIAARAGFDAFVTRDQAQTNQLVEMYVLSRLRGFTIITWKKPIEDPVREWGQLLAYLPEIKKRLEQRGPRRGSGGVILLPAPSLPSQNLLDPRHTIGLEASRRGISNRQARDEAVAETRDWLEMTGMDSTEFDDVL